MSIPDMFGRRKDVGNPNRKEPLMAENIPAPRFLAASQPGREAPAPSRYRSEAAALAAQHVEDLEHEVRDSKARYQIEVDALKTQVYELKGELATVKTANTMLNTECEALRTAGEANSERLREHRAKLDVAIKIILDLAREEQAATRPSAERASAERASAEGESAVGESLSLSTAQARSSVHD